MPLEIPQPPSRAPWDAKFHESPTKHSRFADGDFPCANSLSLGRNRSFNDRPATVNMQPPWRGTASSQQCSIRPSTVSEAKSRRQPAQVPSGRQTPQASSGRQAPIHARPITVSALESTAGLGEVVDNRPVTVAEGKSRPLGCPNGRTSAFHSIGSEHMPRYYGNKYAGKRFQTTHAEDSYHTHFVGPTTTKFGPWTSDLNACGVSMFEGMLGTKYAGLKNLSSIGHNGLWATGKCGPHQSDVAHWQHESDFRRAGRPAPNKTCAYRRGPEHELTQGQFMNLKTGPPRPRGPYSQTIRRRVAPPIEGDVKVPADQTAGFYSCPIEPLVLRRFKAQHPPRARNLATAAQLHERCKRRQIRLLKKADEMEVQALNDWAPAVPKEPVEEEEVVDPKAKGKKDAKGGKSDPKAKGKK